MNQWYEELFTNYARTYDDQIFTKGTNTEVDFIEKEINYDKKSVILDVGCGTGRHSIELARRGYKVTGVDLSADQLKRAKEKAVEAGVKVNFLQQDARLINFKDEFDLVILICEGAFPLMETDEMNFKILENITNALKKKGKLIMTTLNGLYPLHNSLDNFNNEGNNDFSIIENNFDPVTMRNISQIRLKDDSGNLKYLTANERYYLPEEIEILLNSLGYKSVKIFGCECGKFSRKLELTPDHFEMLIIAEK
jgi:2-polyprenyl-3-methyl-5-hydroxy-6-metoxy-1,4-benzoquinol methylase